MPEQFIVYLSSTLDDLLEERDIAIKAISAMAVVKTSYQANENRTTSSCLDDVRTCHLYVGILGRRYGWVPPPDVGGADGKSITELEYDACNWPRSDPHRPSIPRLMFLKSNEAGIPDKYVDAYNNLPAAPKIAKFRDRAAADQRPCEFKNIHELRSHLSIGVYQKYLEFQRAQEDPPPEPNPGGRFKDPSPWKGQLAQVMVGCVPGTDAAQQAALTAAGAMFTPFELRPDDPSYLATLDAGLARGQIGALLLTPASLMRLTEDERSHMVATAIAMLRARTGHALLICEGIEKGKLPAEWNAASALYLPEAALAGIHGSVANLYSRIREIDGRLTQNPCFALPYLVIAPTLSEVEKMVDESQDAFTGFGAAKTLRKSEFDRIAKASRGLQPTWPIGTYAAERHDWKCFSGHAQSAEKIVRDSIERINDAGEGSREMRALRGARLIPRRYGIDEYLEDRWGSRQMIMRLRESASLILIDEVALLDRRLRQIADDILSKTCSAVVAISPCDPAHTGIEALLDDISYLKVGNLVSRYRNDLDPNCEIAANTINRMERWLSATLPGLVASVGEQQSDPDLLRRMQQVLAR